MTELEHGQRRPERRSRRRSSLIARGEPQLWLTGGALAIALAMIVGLLALILWQGMKTFWPLAVVRIETVDGTVFMGEVQRREEFRLTKEMADALPEASKAKAETLLTSEPAMTLRELVRTGNFELTNTHFNWVNDFAIQKTEEPQWALVFERKSTDPARKTWGRFYGFPEGFIVKGEAVADSPEGAWNAYLQFHDEAMRRNKRIERLEKYDIGKSNARMEKARLSARRAELKFGKGSPEHQAALEGSKKDEALAQEEYARAQEEIKSLRAQNNDYQLLVRTAQGQEKTLWEADLVRAYPANQLSLRGKVKVYLSRWAEFLTQDPREANSEGGVFPAIVGTVLMTLIMSLLVTPFGVLSALYLREYAKAGPIVSAVRIAVNNLAGVPSIVYGVFGLGFFCYIIGVSIDQSFFPARLPNPTYGKGALIWASFSLALLTLPVVIVATEEALAAVPNSMREGSYACGASKWQTIQRIVMPRALPGVMTGMILAIARGAGEVAPLMLVGAVKLATELPLDAQFPFFHPERSFMHLGFHIYDLGFQSQNSEAAKPMVFTTTLLLIIIVAALNIGAIWIRSRLRRRFAGSQF